MPELNMGTPRKAGDIYIKEGVPQDDIAVSSVTPVPVFDAQIENYEGNVGFCVSNTGAESIEVTVTASYDYSNDFPVNTAYVLTLVDAEVLAAAAVKEWTLPPLSPYTWVRLSLAAPGAASIATCWVRCKGRS